MYAVVDRSITANPVDLARALLAGGIRIIQYRAKSGVARDVVVAMHGVTRAYDASLIVNDDVDMALLADGLHVGQEDIATRDMRAVRARLGKRFLGISCGLPEEVAPAEALGADYIGAGPFAATRSKVDAGPAIASFGIAAVVAAATVPVAAIGGITLTNIAEVRRTGAAMAAILSALAVAPDPQVAAAAFVAAWG